MFSRSVILYWDQRQYKRTVAIRDPTHSPVLLSSLDTSKARCPLVVVEKAIPSPAFKQTFASITTSTPASPSLETQHIFSLDDDNGFPQGIPSLVDRFYDSGDDSVVDNSIFATINTPHPHHHIKAISNIARFYLTISAWSSSYFGYSCDNSPTQSHWNTASPSATWPPPVIDQFSLFTMPKQVDEAADDPAASAITPQAELLRWQYNLAHWF